ncbi:glycosyltransferase family 4 protein [Methanococcoides sp. SA1]|nr:glycosyltransferase family 4 protein [Methanococcoides sp. SA1]
MKKVLFLGRFPMPMHGAAKMNELYYNSLQKKYNVKKIKINYSKFLEEVGVLNFKKILGVFIVFFQTLWNLLFFRPNLVYFEIAPKGFAFLRDSIYVLMCKLFRRKIIFALHSRELVKNVDSLYYRFVLKNCKMILLSKSLYGKLNRLFPKEDVYFLGNGIENDISDSEFSSILKARSLNKKTTLLFLSNMIESKGPIEVLKICKKLKEDEIPFECFFVGAFSDNSFEKKWMKKRQGFKLEKECIYLGPKYGKDKVEILSKTNWLIFPTTYPTEAYPLVILEAFMFGIPVVSYDTGAISNVVPEDYLGFVSKRRTPEDIYSYLKNNILKRNEIKIREYFKKNFTIEIAEIKLNKIIEKELR